LSRLDGAAKPWGQPNGQITWGQLTGGAPGTGDTGSLHLLIFFRDLRGKAQVPLEICWDTDFAVCFPTQVRHCGSLKMNFKMRLALAGFLTCKQFFFKFEILHMKYENFWLIF